MRRRKEKATTIARRIARFGGSRGYGRTKDQKIKDLENRLLKLARAVLCDERAARKVAIRRAESFGFRPAEEGWNK